MPKKKQFGAEWKKKAKSYICTLAVFPPSPSIERLDTFKISSSDFS